MSIQHEKIMVLGTERHPRIAIAAEPAPPTKGWIVMRSWGVYDGGLEPEEPHTVYFDHAEAVKVAQNTDRLEDQNMVIEVAVPR